MTDELRQCKSCLNDKPLSEYYVSHGVIARTCKSCQSSKTAAQRAQKRRENGKDSGFVYFVLAEEVKRIKIGFTFTGMDVRLANLQGQSPCVLSVLACIPGDLTDEKDLHKRFEHQHSHHEWFNDCAEIRAYIDLIVQSKSFEVQS